MPEASERHRAENQEIVERLDLGPLLGAVTARDDGGRADEAKFQPTPSSVSEIQKCATVSPAIPTKAETSSMASPSATMRLTP